MCNYSMFYNVLNLYLFSIRKSITGGSGSQNWGFNIYINSPTNLQLLSLRVQFITLVKCNNSFSIPNTQIKDNGHAPFMPLRYFHYLLSCFFSV